jgi:hypothetical protein
MNRIVFTLLIATFIINCRNSNSPTELSDPYEEHPIKYIIASIYVNSDENSNSQELRAQVNLINLLDQFFYCEGRFEFNLYNSYGYLRYWAMVDFSNPDNIPEMNYDSKLFFYPRQIISRYFDIKSLGWLRKFSSWPPSYGSYSYIESGKYQIQFTIHDDIKNGIIQSNKVEIIINQNSEVSEI